MLMMMMMVVLYQGMPCNASAGMIEWESTIQPSPPSPSYFELYILVAFGVKEEKIGAPGASTATEFLASQDALEVMYVSE